MTEKAYSPADEGDVKKREATAAFKAKQHAQDWQWLLADPKGRRIVWSLLQEAQFWGVSFVPGAGDQTAFNEGMRRVGSAIHNTVMKIDRDAYVRMVDEATKAA